MTTSELVPIEVSNPSYGDLNGATVFLTRSLAERLSSEKNRRGQTVLSLLREGRAVQGMKHLVATVVNSSADAKIVFTEGPTSRHGHEYRVSYSEYRKAGGAAYRSLYSQTGYDLARQYLFRHFPDSFAAPPPFDAAELRKLSSNLGGVLEVASSSTNGQTLMMLRLSESISKMRHRSARQRRALRTLQSQSRAAYYREVVADLEDRLRKPGSFRETQGSGSWQKWVYQHYWLLGANYLEPITNLRVGFRSIPDFLFPTLDGFLDILEVKLPTVTVVRADDSHPGTYCWCPATNAAIGQVVTYLQQVELNQLTLKREIERNYSANYSLPPNPLKPRAFILAGTSDGWSEQTREALRILNYSLHDIEVVTYSDLLRRGESIIRLLERRVD